MQKKVWSISLGVTGLLAVALMGCVAAIPIAISYYKTSSSYVATAEVAHPADKVYAVVVKEA